MEIREVKFLRRKSLIGDEVTPLCPSKFIGKGRSCKFLKFMGDLNPLEVTPT